MASGPMFVPPGTLSKAKAMIDSRDGNQIRDGVELLLKADLSKPENAAEVNGRKVDCSNLLKKGLDSMSEAPHQALGLDLAAQTIDIKKNFKKLALKYHPDKNPMTTPIFQAIQLAKEKLSDPSVRRDEADAARRRDAKQRHQKKGPTTSSSSNAGYGGGGFGSAYAKQPQRPEGVPKGYYQPGQQGQPGGYGYAKQHPHPPKQEEAPPPQQSSRTYYTQQQRAEKPGGRPEGYGRYQYEGSQQKHDFDEEWNRRRTEHAFKQAEQARLAEQARMAKELERRRQEEQELRERAANRQRESAAEHARQGQAAFAQEQERLRRAREEQTRNAPQYNADGRDREANRAAAAAAARRFHSKQAADGGDGQASPRGGPEPTQTPDNYSNFANRNRMAREEEQRKDREKQEEEARQREKAHFERLRQEKIKQQQQQQRRQSQQDAEKQQQQKPEFKPERPLYPSFGGRGRQPPPPDISNNNNIPPPKPVGLRCAGIEPMDNPTTKEAGTGDPNDRYAEGALQWIVPPNVGVELSWRRTPMQEGTDKRITSSWESAKKLVVGGRCVKKNLVENSIYEIRVRSVNELEAGVFGAKSEWCGPIVINVKSRAERPRRPGDPILPPKEAPKVPQPKASAPTPKGPTPTAAATPKTETENHNKGMRNYHNRSPRGSGEEGYGVSASAAAYETPPKPVRGGTRSKVDKEWKIHTESTDDASQASSTNDGSASEIEEEEGESESTSGSDNSSDSDSDSDDENEVLDDAGGGFKSPNGRSPRWSDMQREQTKEHSPSTSAASSTNSTSSPSSNEKWFLLNCPGESRDYQHPVFAEPLQGSRLVGYLVSGLPIANGGLCGDWAKVRVHRRLKVAGEAARRDRQSSTSTSESNSTDDGGDGGVAKWGWCEHTYESHSFLVPTSSVPDYPSNPPGAGPAATPTTAGGGKTASPRRQVKKEVFFSSEAEEVRAEEEKAKRAAKLQGKDKRHSFSGGIDTSTLKQAFAQAQAAQSPKASKKEKASRMTAKDHLGGPDMGSTLEKEGFTPKAKSKASAAAKAKVYTAATGGTKTSATGAAKANTEKPKPPSTKPPPTSSVPIWHECRDDSGNLYFFNEVTQESSWESPEWVEEVDPESGVSYYLKLNSLNAQPLHSTWSKPKVFAKIVREHT